MSCAEDDIMNSQALQIELLHDQLAELRGPVLTAMINHDRDDAYLMYQLTMGAHGRPGICWKHGAVDSVEQQIASDWRDYYSCGQTDCSYHALELTLERSKS